MIEMVVTAHGLSVHHAMHAVVMTDARQRVQVMAGKAHPPTFVAADAAWGLYDEGMFPPGDDDLVAWMRAVYGQSAGSLLPLRRTNVVDAGRGIEISAVRGGASLLVRPTDGNAVTRFTWAGPADVNVDGIVDFNDLMVFLANWEAGGDYDGDGVRSGMDVAAFLAVWHDAGRPPCQADADGNGVVDVFDLMLYMEWWNFGDARADLEGVSPGVVDVFDLSVFVSAWMDGC